jgi:hypothetical protein
MQTSQILRFLDVRCIWDEMSHIKVTSNKFSASTQVQLAVVELGVIFICYYRILVAL